MPSGKTIQAAPADWLGFGAEERAVRDHPAHPGPAGAGRKRWAAAGPGNRRRAESHQCLQSASISITDST